MPIYEFRCLECRRKTTALVLTRARAGEVRCKACGSDRLERLASRFATVTPEGTRLQALAEGAMSGSEESDPRTVARFMKHFGEQMGEDPAAVDRLVDEELSETATDAEDAVPGSIDDD